MRAALYALVAVMLYSIMNVVVEQKLARYNAAALLVCGYAIMVPLALLRCGYLRATGGPIAFPAGPFLVLAFAIGILYFTGDFFFLSAFTSASGSVMTVTTILVLTPVFSSLVKYFYTGGGLPNSYQVVGYLCAATAVFFIAKGSLTP